MVNSFEDQQAQGSRVRQEHTMSVVMVGEQIRQAGSCRSYQELWLLLSALDSLDIFPRSFWLFIGNGLPRSKDKSRDTNQDASLIIQAGHNEAWSRVSAVGVMRGWNIHVSVYSGTSVLIVNSHRSMSRVQNKRVPSGEAFSLAGHHQDSYNFQPVL